MSTTRKPSLLPKNLGERVYSARLEASAAQHRRISQVDLGVMVARALGEKRAISAATVSRWESGDALPSVPTVAAIAKVCGVDPGWMAFGADSLAPSPRQQVVKVRPPAAPRSFAPINPEAWRPL